MNKYKSKMFQTTLVIAAIICMSSCMNSAPQDTKNVAEEKNDKKFETKKSEKDAQFLVNASEINLEEISLGQLAQQKSTNIHVKELGKMLEIEHTKSLNDLNALAKAKNISLPTSQTESGKDAYIKLNEKSGNEFGKKYSDMMVTGHKDAIALFENASTESKDPDIKAWASSMLSTLKTHLEHSLMCQKECNKM